MREGEKERGWREVEKKNARWSERRWKAGREKEKVGDLTRIKDRRFADRNSVLTPYSATNSETGARPSGAC